MISFLRQKLSGTSFTAVIRGQIESWLFWIFNGLPSVPGFVLRFLMCKLLFKKLNGFIWLQPRVEIVDAGNIVCGANVAINTGSYINGRGGITMGKNVLIGSNVTISSGQHPIDDISGDVFEQPTIPKAIVIEDGVWIGAGAVIMPGVVLGRGSVVGANAVVTKSTAPYSVNVGAPARCLRLRLVKDNESMHPT